MINVDDDDDDDDDEDDEKYYCFAVKSKLKLYSSEWLWGKNEAMTNNDNSFQNALDDALNYQTIKANPARISKLKSKLNQCNWKYITFPSDKEDWKKFEQNNEEIAWNILVSPHNKEEIWPAYKSKHNHKRKNQVILFMITGDGKRWHYLAVKRLSASLREISSSNNRDFYCWNCFHSYRTHNKLKKHERVCNNHDYCNVDMPKEHEKIKYLAGEKSLKVPFTIYADLEGLLKKVRSCQNNPENTNTEKKAKHKPSGCAWCSICSFDDTKNRHYFYREKDCIEKFCKDLKELGTEIINFEEKEMMSLTNTDIESYQKQKVYYICKEGFAVIKTRKKVRDHCHYTGKFRGTAHSECNLR